MVTSLYKGLQGVTRDYKVLAGVTMGYGWYGMVPFFIHGISFKYIYIQV